MVYFAIATSRASSTRAVDCFEQAKQLEPDSYRWPYYLGRLFMARRSPERARLEFAECVKLNPEYAMAYAWLGDIELRDEQGALAKAHFERYRELRPDDFYGLAALAGAELALENNEQAFELLSESLRRREDYGLAFALFSQYYTAIGRNDLAEAARGASQALPTSIEAHKRDPLALEAWCILGNTPALLQRIDAFAQQGDTESAILLTERIVEDDPDDHELWARLGYYYHHLGRYDEAAGAARRVLEIQPDFVRAYVVLADCNLSQRRYEEALSEAERALEIDDSVSQAHIAKGRALTGLSRFGEAEAAFRRAEELQPRSARLIVAIGDTLLAQGKLEQAKARYQGVLNMARDEGLPLNRREQVALHMVLGRIAEDQQDTDTAVAWLMKVMQMDPGNRVAYQQLVDLLIASGRADKALEMCRFYAENHPKHPFFQFALGDVLFRTGSRAEAADQLRAALELAPDYAGGRVMMARVHHAEGRMEEAKQELELAIKAEADFPEPYVMLTTLCMEEKDYDTPLTVLRTGMERIPESVVLYNGLAWILAAHPDASKRDPAEAIKLAEHACELTKNQSAGVLDTLATAYASAGRFEEAVKTERLAIERVSTQADAENTDDFRARLALFEAGKPFVEGK
jgi:tetratricopeptide (TPR) repeat protein